MQKVIPFTFIFTKPKKKPIKMKTLIFLFATIVVNQIYTQNYNYSIVRVDNDYANYKDVHSIKELNPPKVIEKLKNVLNELDYSLIASDFVTYKITVNSNIDLYVLLIYEFPYNLGKVFAYNKVLNEISVAPLDLNIKWGFNNEVGFTNKLLDYPLIETAIKNETIEIIIKERVHNGNIYNAVIKKHYTLNSDLSFTLDFCFEKICLLWNGQKIKRVLVNDTIFAYLDLDLSLQYIGNVQFDRKTKKVIKRECIVSEYCEVLFTSSPDEDEYFLKNGYTFFY